MTIAIRIHAVVKIFGLEKSHDYENNLPRADYFRVIIVACNMPNAF